MTETYSDRHSSEKVEEKYDSIAVMFNNIDGVQFTGNIIGFWYVVIADEMFVTCERPRKDILEASTESIYKQDIIETIQDWYKMKVKELNWIKR